MHRVGGVVTEIYQYVTLLHVVWLSLGGAFGAALRFCVGQALLPVQRNWPWATWSVNLGGSLLLGFIAAYFNDYGYSAGFMFWELGVLGGFTTMSSFAAETLALSRGRHSFMALGYILATAFGGLAAIVLGFTLGGLVS